MKNAVLYLSWFAAFFVAAIYAKVFEIPLWEHIIIQTIPILCFILGIYSGLKQ